MSSSRWIEFDPPEKGLNEGETVVWNKKAGVSFLLLWCGGCLPLLTVFAAFFILEILGPQLGNLVLAMDGIVILYLFYLVIQSKRTHYYITSERLLEVRGRFIQNEIPITNLQGCVPDEFMKTKLSHDEGAYSYYDIRIKDPVSGKVIRLSSLREDALDVLKKLGNP